MLLGGSLAVFLLSFCNHCVDGHIIPSNYSKGTSPSVGTPDTPLDIWISMRINEIQNVDTDEMSIKLNMYLRVSWMDTRLIYPEHDKNSSTTSSLNTDLLAKLWVPDHFFRKMIDVKHFRLLQDVKGFKLYRNGTVYTSAFLELKIGCPMDFKAYPFDQQECRVTLSSYFHYQEELRFNWLSSGLQYDESAIKESAHYRVSFIRTEQTICRCQHCITDEPCVEFGIVLKRYYLAQILGYYIPSSLFMGISWSSFFWPADVVPGRTVLVITSLLAASNLYSDSRQSSPKTSYVKALDAWMFFSIIVPTMTLFQYAVVLQWLKKAGGHKTNSVKPYGSSAGCSCPVYKIYQERTEKIGKLCLPILFFMFNLAYWLYVLNYV